MSFGARRLNATGNVMNGTRGIEEVGLAGDDGLGVPIEAGGEAADVVGD